MTKEEILNDEMSDHLLELIDKNEPLRQWIYDAMEVYANNNKLTECRNCGENVEMISTGEICPKCYC